MIGPSVFQALFGENSTLSQRAKVHGEGEEAPAATEAPKDEDAMDIDEGKHAPKPQRTVPLPALHPQSTFILLSQFSLIF